MNEEGKGFIAIDAMNSNNNVFVKMKLFAENFEEYFYSSDNVSNVLMIGLNMSHL